MAQCQKVGEKSRTVFAPTTYTCEPTFFPEPRMPPHVLQAHFNTLERDVKDAFEKFREQCQELHPEFRVTWGLPPSGMFPNLVTTRLTVSLAFDAPR